MQKNLKLCNYSTKPSEHKITNNNEIININQP